MGRAPHNTGLQVTSQRLRHSCATLLLNAAAPILAVQTKLGHKNTDTTLGYARLYYGTLAADCYRAMGNIESRLELQKSTRELPPNTGQLLALVDALRAGTLNESQKTVLELRAGILAMVEHGDEMTGDASGSASQPGHFILAPRPARPSSWTSTGSDASATSR